MARSLLSRCLFGLLLATLLVASSAIPTTAATVTGVVVDQQQPTIDGTVGGLVIGSIPKQVIAQTVTTGIPGFLEGVRLPLGCDPDATLTLQIEGVSAAGVPNGTVLSTQDFAGSSLPAPVNNFRELPLASPVFMSIGQRFAIVLTATAQDALSGCGVFQGPVGDSYTGGDIYFQSIPNGLGNWICQCVFAGARLDLPFQTLVLGATFDGVNALTQQFVSDPGVANSLTAKLAAAQLAAQRGDLTAKEGALNAFANEVQAQSGKELTQAQADLLVELVRLL